MKKALFVVLFTFLSSAVFVTASTPTWEWSISESAESFESSMENREDGGILYDNFPLTNWTVKITNSDEFGKLINNRNDLKIFIAERVFNLAMDSGIDHNKCYSARDFLKKAGWMR